MIKFGFDDETVSIFTEGDCWLLANVISEMYNYEPCVIGYTEDEWYHAVNRLPSGLIVDIHGVMNADEAVAVWDLSGLGGLELYENQYPVECSCGYDWYPDDQGSAEMAIERAIDQAKLIYEKLLNIKGLII